MKTIKINLASKTYEVEKLPILGNRDWRKRFDEPIGKILRAAKTIKALTGEKWETPKDMMQAVGMALVSHVDELTEVLLGSIDTITDAVFAYSPVLRAERQYIEANGYDDEMVRAFLEVAQLAYPFSAVIKNVIELGSRVDGTSPNSSEPSGDSGKTS